MNYLVSNRFNSESFLVKRVTENNAFQYFVKILCNKVLMARKYITLEIGGKSYKLAKYVGSGVPNMYPVVFETSDWKTCAFYTISSEVLKAIVSSAEGIKGEIGFGGNSQIKNVRFWNGDILEFYYIVQNARFDNCDDVRKGISEIKKNGK